MLRSLFRLFLSSMYLSFRQNVTVSCVEDNYVYEQTYRVSDINAEYKIRISETLFTVNYNLLILPNLKRVIYDADLTYIVNGVVSKKFRAQYPRLTLGGDLDPLYPLAVVASTHLEIFLTTEEKL